MHECFYADLSIMFHKNYGSKLNCVITFYILFALWISFKCYSSSMIPTLF